MKNEKFGTSNREYRMYCILYSVLYSTVQCTVQYIRSIVVKTDPSMATVIHKDYIYQSANINRRNYSIPIKFPKQA